MFNGLWTVPPSVKGQEVELMVFKNLIGGN